MADMPMSLEEVQAIIDRPALIQPASTGSAVLNEPNQNEAQKARVRALIDGALSVGLKAGLAHQINKIQETIEVESGNLDQIYNFQAFMIQGRVVPPVVTEARNLYNQEGEQAVRLSGVFYKIERQARFASVAPNWREYLYFAKPKIDPYAYLSILGPTSSAEKSAWQEGVRDGWRQGVEQANLMLTQGLDRLNRDFTGMARFHKLCVEGKVSMPVIAVQDVAVSKEGATMALDETLLRLTTLPDFNGNQSKWQALIQNHSVKRKK